MSYDFPVRKIIHIDMDAFFASVEQLDNPELQGKPVAVGGGEKRGVVAAASYEAREFGVRSAMSGYIARQKCPQLLFITPRFDRYKEISRSMRDILFDYTDLVEPLSLDEAYLDVTENKVGNPSATLIAREIRQRIYDELQLTASAGISINKFIAKVASDINKPNGQKTIAPDKVLSFLESLPVLKFYGVGKVTAEKMHQMGIFSGADLKTKSPEYLREHFGKSGTYYYNVVRGIHRSEVKPERVPKSVGLERTFADNLSSEVFLLEKLEKITGQLEERLQRSGVAGKTITLKIRYSDFKLQTRSKTMSTFLNKREEIFNIARGLLLQEELSNSVRLLGVSVSNLNTSKGNSESDGPEQPYSVQLTFDF